MKFLDIFSEMLVILFSVCIGYIAHRKGYLGGDLNPRITSLILNLTMPCMILAAVLTGENNPSLQDVISVLEVAAIFYGLEAVFALFLPRLLGGTPAQKGVWRFGLAFPNVGFIGYPVAVALFGPSALFYAVILALPFNLLSFTLGPLMLGGRARFRWQQLCSPSALAALASLVFALTGLRPPALIGEALDFAGSVTVPLALMLVGSLLAGIPLKTVLSSGRVWVLTLVRLLGLPVLLWLILRPMGLDSMVLGIAVIQMAMPLAVNGTLLCMQVGGDVEAMTQATFLSTVGSILTIPLLAMLLL